eukprot:GCRY01000270.1.p1 GENE.GCRY01000270.1~~GCRY01000270.1.p1  ORF type:complete len:505 (+),score=96.45 GCRY01000270.1:104-1618(+)
MLSRLYADFFKNTDILISFKNFNRIIAGKTCPKDAPHKAFLTLRQTMEQEKHAKPLFELDSGFTCIPHPSKVEQQFTDLLSHGAGEDSCFVLSNALGIADGVGGWAKSHAGSNAALFSRLLMHHSREVLINSPREETNLVSVLKTALDQIDLNLVVGSSTVSLCMLEGSLLKIANLGDSGILVIRQGQLVLKTNPLLHSWNFPFQVGTNGDNLNNTQLSEVQIEEGDVIVVCTDGVLDNLFEYEIVEIVNSALSSNMLPSEISACIANLACDYSQDTERHTPFAEEARRAGHLDRRLWSGGKMDDIAVVVGVVHSTAESDNPPSRAETPLSQEDCDEDEDLEIDVEDVSFTSSSPSSWGSTAATPNWRFKSSAIQVVCEDGSLLEVGESETDDGTASEEEDNQGQEDEEEQISLAFPLPGNEMPYSAAAPEMEKSPFSFSYDSFLNENGVLPEELDFPFDYDSFEFAAPVSMDTETELIFGADDFEIDCPHSSEFASNPGVSVF